MNNFLISVICGVIFAIELVAMYLGWASVKKFNQFLLFNGSALFLLMLGAYKLAVCATCALISRFDIVNDVFVHGLFFAPILISVLTSIAALQFKKRPNGNFLS